MNKCLICDRIEFIKQKKNPYFVKELKTGYVVLGDFQYYRGYTLFLSKIHANELHELDKDLRLQFLEEMGLVAEAVYKAFKPLKLNYELLGNSDPHVHWHIFPRYKNDSNPKSPVWIIDKSVRYAETARPTKEQLEELKIELLKHL